MTRRIHLGLIAIIFCFSSVGRTAQKAKIIGEVVEVYSDADFDSEVLDEVHGDESYLVSDKSYGAFYRIKLKNGKIGYVVDYELNIEGKGPLKAQDYDSLFLEDEKKRLKDIKPEDEESSEETEVFGKTNSGISLQLVNFHENTLGADQVDDLTAIGYKSISDISWSVLAAFKAPKYYAAKTGGSANGFKLWADVGYSNTLAYVRSSEIRFSGNLFTQISMLKVETPLRSYDLHDLTLGLALEGAVLIHLGKYGLDLGIKYYFDRSSYAGLGLTFLF